MKAENWIVEAAFAHADNLFVHGSLPLLKEVLEQTPHKDTQLPIVKAHGLVILTEKDFVEWFDGEGDKEDCHPNCDACQHFDDCAYCDER